MGLEIDNLTCLSDYMSQTEENNTFDSGNRGTGMTLTGTGSWIYAYDATSLPHGGDDPGYDNENFSDDGKDGNDNLKISGHLGTHGVIIKKYDPDTVMPRVALCPLLD